MHFKMSSATSFKLDQSKILSSGDGLSFKLLSLTLEPLADIVDQDQTAQNGFRLDTGFNKLS